MTRTLVIPDVHHKHVRAQVIIDNVEADRIVLLGDYFDQFSDSVCDTDNTARWLKEMVLTNPKITPLIGNHDISYFYPMCQFLRCSGFTEAKMHAIRRIITHEDVEKFKVFTTDQNFVLSHAGLTNGLWKEMVQWNEEKREGPPNLEFFVKVLQTYVDRSMHMLSVLRNPPLFAPGMDRGGFAKHGGINWVDFRNFAPIKGINQIFGHTPQGKFPTILLQKKHGTIKTFSALTIEQQKHNPFEGATSENYALDTHLDHYVIIEDGKVIIYDAATGKTVKELLATGVLPKVKFGETVDAATYLPPLTEEDIKNALEFNKNIGAITPVEKDAETALKYGFKNM